MLGKGLLGMMMVAATTGLSQNAASYMAPIWAGGEIKAWEIPFDVQSEPIGRAWQVNAPFEANGKSWLPVWEGDPQQAAVQTQLLPVSRGLGGLLELAQGEIPTSSHLFATPSPNDGGLLISRLSGKKGKGKAQIGVLKPSGEFLPFSWSDGLANDLQPVLAGSNRMYFQSDRIGGLGGMDIWTTEWKAGTWTIPVPVGQAINTTGDEIHPRIGTGGELIFSSNGRNNPIGSFDLFSWDGSTVSKLPYPFNSKFDDFELATAGAGEFWVVSNRPTEALRTQGPAQLFRFRPRKALQLSTRHARSGQPLPRQKVQVSTERESFQAESDEKGTLNLYLEAGEWVDVMVARADYDTLRVKRLTIGSPGYLLLTEKKYWQLSLEVFENGQLNNRNAKVLVLEKEQLIDSMTTDSKGKVVRELNPSSAYRFVVSLPGYQSRELTITTNSAGKNLYSRAVHFGSKDSEFVRWQIRDTTGQPLQGAKIIVFEYLVPVPDIAPAPTDTRGMGGAALKEGRSYNLVAMAEGMVSFKNWNTIANSSGIDTSEVIMEMAPLTPGTVIARIHCPIDPFVLQQGRIEQMHSVLHVLRENPDLKVEIGVYTDARGSAAENLSKSKQAADFAMDFFVGKGIAKNRLTFKGYGESKILNRCLDGVNCTEDEHVVNNRLEIRVN